MTRTPMTSLKIIQLQVFIYVFVCVCSIGTMQDDKEHDAINNKADVIGALNDVIQSESDDMNADQIIDIQLPFITIPAAETTYVCQQFEISDDKPYHVTRFEPIINNTDAIHHMLLFGCEFEMDEKGPHVCGSLDFRCRSWLVKWDVGMKKDIVMPSDTGVRIGQGSFKYLLLQIHWNNPDKMEDWTDMSGMRLHVTSKLRQHDIGNVQLGQNAIDIPAGTRDYVISGECPGACTAIMLPTPIYITDIYLHMHELGIQSALDISRDREIVQRLALEEDYNFTQPVWHHLDPPAVAYPGDSLRVTCWYNSKDGTRHRHINIGFGQGSMAEMCYAFIRYYPRLVGFDQCVQNGTYNLNC